MTVVHRLSLSLVIGLLAAAPLAAQAPTGTITGGVVDSATQQPLADVNVVVQGTQRGAVSGPDGTFTIGSVPAGSQILRARRVGFSVDPREFLGSLRRADGPLADASLRAAIGKVAPGIRSSDRSRLLYPDAP